MKIYLHIPFCSKKCPYCHFFVIKEEESKKDLLLNALLEEWEERKSQITTPITSIYFGGGTPTLMGPARLKKLLDRITPPPSAEITIEANPEQLTPSLAEELRAIGINRFSIGIQSLNDCELKILGRTHSAAEAKAAVLNAGIENITIDLMYELPGQTLDSWRNSLEQLSELPITHLSLYNLTFEPNTPFYRKKEQLQSQVPPSKICKKMLDMAVEKLAQLGLKRYEISAFAKPGFEAVHNSGYWRGDSFFGLGPSAFSFFEGKRFRNACNFPKYLNPKTRYDFTEELPYPDNLKELLAINLRLFEGVNLKQFQNRWGELPTTTRQTLKQLEQRGYLNRVQERLTLSDQGLLFYDSVAVEII